MATFAELWDKSRAFRQLFMHRKVFRSAYDVDASKAEVLWYYRWPRIEWGFCGHDGCIGLASKGYGCGEHFAQVGDGKIPRWKWHQGFLYRYMMSRDDVLAVGRRHLPLPKQDGLLKSHVPIKEYVAYHKHMMELCLDDRIPNRYRVAYADGNPFNLAPINLVLISEIVEPAVIDGRISVQEAIEIDELIAGKFRKIGRVPNQWIYNVSTIAKAANVRPERVRQVIADGSLEPKDLASVIAFCQKRHRSSKV